MVHMKVMISCNVLLTILTLLLQEKLMLEPFSSARDVAYIALVPENKYILRCASTYFRELTAVYEVTYYAMP